MSILLDNGEHRPRRQLERFWRYQIRYRLARRLIYAGLWVMPEGRYKTKLLESLWALYDEVCAVPNGQGDNAA